MNQKLQIILQKTAQSLKKLYGPKMDKLILFGSQARGDAQPDSDIDILIVLKPPFNYSQESDRISELIANLCLEYNTLISCAFTTSNQFYYHDNGFLRNIRREGIIL